MLDLAFFKWLTGKITTKATTEDKILPSNACSFRLSRQPQKKNVCCKHDCEALCGLHVISHIMGLHELNICLTSRFLSWRKSFSKALLRSIYKVHLQHYLIFILLLPLQDDYIPYPRIEEVQQFKFLKALYVRSAECVSDVSLFLFVWFLFPRCCSGVSHTLRSSCLSSAVTGLKILTPLPPFPIGWMASVMTKMEKEGIQESLATHWRVTSPFVRTASTLLAGWELASI